MKRIIWTIGGMMLGAGLLMATTAFAVSASPTAFGGTGTTSPSGILSGDNGATTHLNTVIVGAGCTFIANTLSCPGTGGAASYPFLTIGSLANATSTLTQFTGGITAYAATSTITNLTQVTGTTTNATSTNLDVSGTLRVASISALLLSTSGNVSAYGGTGACGGGTAITALSGVGGATCTAFSGFSYPFNTLTNFGTTTAATSTPIWAQFGIFASSSSAIASTTFDATGNVLISTSTLTQGCNIFSGVCEVNTVAGGNYTGFSAVANAGANMITTILGSSNTLLGEVGTITGHDFRIIAGGTDLIHLSNASKTVGINTTSATTNRLEVKTAVSGGYFGIDNSTTGDVFEVTTTGVGVASSTPNSGLSVGSGNASSSISVAEYAYGKAGNFATSTSVVLTPRTANTILFPIGASATTLTLCGFQPGDTLKVIVKNPSQAAGAVTWTVCAGYQLDWAGQTVPTQTTTANTWDVWSFIATDSVGSSTPNQMVISGAQSSNF